MCLKCLPESLFDTLILNCGLRIRGICHILHKESFVAFKQLRFIFDYSPKTAIQALIDLYMKS